MNIPALYLSLYLALFLTLLSDYKAGVMAVDLLGYPCRDPDSTFTQSVLDTHNLYRASHNDTSPLCLSQKLIDSAEQYAQRMAVKDDRLKTQGGFFDHDPNNIIEGENLCRTTRDMLEKQGAAHCVKKCISQWYKTEEPLFNYSNKKEAFNPARLVSWTFYKHCLERNSGSGVRSGRGNSGYIRSLQILSSR
ncbi:hypothetical protein ACHWQZ_G018008 [Mnemiopsis leidyi]